MTDSSDRPEDAYDDSDLSIPAPLEPSAIETQVEEEEVAPAGTHKANAAGARKDSKFIHFLAGGIAGSLAATFTMPLDVVKTRKQASLDAQLRSIMQANERRLFTQTFHSIVNIFKTEGFRGLFRGLGPNLFGIAPSRAIYFFTYNLSKENVPRLSGGRWTKDSPIVHLTSAAIGGVAVATVMNPVWLVKTRIQLQDFSSSSPTNTKSSTIHYSGYIDCVRKIYHTEGPRGFYKGLFASYMGVSETAIYFVIYEQLRKEVMKHSHTQFNAVDLFLLAGFTKLLASISTYPHEVVRTRMRQVGQINPATASASISKSNGPKYKYNGVIGTFKLIAREEGIRGLYSGMGAHLMRTVPNAAIMMLTYESIIALFSKHER